MVMLHSVELVLAIQRISHPFLVILFRGISFLGSEFFYFAVLVFLYWGMHRRLAFRLALGVLFSLYWNFLLKDFFQIPRPQGEGLRILEKPEDFSFPSGHAQSVATFWFLLAFMMHKSRFYFLAGILTVLISLSRLYLGVHFLQDVLGGSLLGIIVAILGFGLLRFFSQRRFSFLLTVPVLFLISFLLFLYAPSSLGVKVAGSLSGVLFGYWFTGFFELPERSFTKRDWFLGILSLLLIYLGGKMLPFSGNWWLFVRYVILNYFATFGFPFLVNMKARPKEPTTHC
ncbi:MAG: phosphatase PAP2 family protein [Atribacterota bacterium]